MEEGWRSIWIITVPERESRKKWQASSIWRKQSEIFPELVRNMFANYRLCPGRKGWALGKVGAPEDRMGSRKERQTKRQA